MADIINIRQQFEEYWEFLDERSVVDCLLRKVLANRKQVNGIMTIYDVVFADLKVRRELDELELRKYTDEVISTCFMQERDAQ